MSLIACSERLIVTLTYNISIEYNIPLICSDLKETVDSAPYVPSSKPPPLIRTLMANGFPQPSLRVPKVDPGEKINIGI